MTGVQTCALPISKDYIREKLAVLQIPETERAENLTIEQFIDLAELFEEK